MDVHVDQARCIGAGNCVLTAPQVFDQRDEDGVAVVRTAQPEADQHDLALQAVELCPAAAITAVER